MPLVSVIIPTFNRETYVIEAVESVLRQTVRDVEIIVVDDGSTDNTRKALERYGSRLTYLFQENAGVSAARNRGIRRASGRWISFLDSDDEWMADYLAVQLKHAEEFPRAVAHITNAVHLFPDGERGTHFAGIGLMDLFAREACFLLEKPFRFIISDRVYWFLQASIMRRDVLLRTGLFNEALSLAEDIDVIGRMALQGPFTFCSEPLVRVWRREEEQDSLLVKLNKGAAGYETFGAVYAGWLEQADLSFGDRRAVARILGSNRRALGNLHLREGSTGTARDWYAKSLLAYPTIRAFIKYCGTFLPRSLSLRLLRKENRAAHEPARAKAGDSGGPAEP